MKNLYIYTEIKGKSNENLENILKILSLNGNSKVKKLTNDEKRLLCLGIAILGHPKYLILDEPMAGLSRPYKRKICNILSVLKKKRIVIFTTHDIKEADILADRKLILSKGKIRCYGSSSYLKEHFKLDYKLNLKTNNYSYVNSVIQNIIPTAQYISNNSANSNINTNNNNNNNNNVDVMMRREMVMMIIKNNNNNC